MSTVSVLLPSMGRVDSLKECIRTIRQTKDEGHVIEIILGLDDTDIASLDLANYLCSNESNIRRVIDSTHSGINAWNLALIYSIGEYLVLAADDLRFHPNWLLEALKAHRDILNGYGVVGLNDLHNDGAHHATHFFLDRKFCIEKLGGVIAFPCYKAYCVDNEILGRAKMHNAYVFSKDAIVEHLHPANGRRAIDATDSARTNDAVIDVELFYKRQAEQFPDNWIPVIHQ